MLAFRLTFWILQTGPTEARPQRGHRRGPPRPGRRVDFGLQHRAAAAGRSFIGVMPGPGQVGSGRRGFEEGGKVWRRSRVGGLGGRRRLIQRALLGPGTRCTVQIPVARLYARV